MNINLNSISKKRQLQLLGLLYLNITLDVTTSVEVISVIITENSIIYKERLAKSKTNVMHFTKTKDNDPVGLCIDRIDKILNEMKYTTLEDFGKIFIDFFIKPPEVNKWILKT